MKKTLLSLALLAGTAGAANAQSMLQNIASRLSYGVKGGGSGAGFTGPGAHDLTYKPGFTAGAFVGLQLTEHFSIQEEFLYSQKGAEMNNFLTSGNKLKATLGYLDVPFMLRYNFGPAGTGFYLEAGPTGSFLLSQKTSVENTAGSEVTSPGTSKDDFTKIVAGYAGGLGYKFGSGLQIGARFNGDFMPVYKKNLGYPELYNGVAQVQVAYGFGGKR